MRTASADHWRSRAGYVCFRERHHLLLVFHARNEGLFISVCPVFKWSGATADVQLCWSFHCPVSTTTPAVFSGLLVTVLSIFASSLVLRFCRWSSASTLRLPASCRPWSLPFFRDVHSLPPCCLCQRCCLVVARCHVTSCPPSCPVVALSVPV